MVLIKKEPVISQRTMIVSANPYASRAGQAILKQGGSAVDAMIAAQAVLTLVEPQSSGIGGGAFMVYWQAHNRQITTLDGRETAPSTAGPNLFMQKSGQAMTWQEAVVGGRAVGTPGSVKLMWEAHQRYGQLPWHQLFDEAIRLSEQGFVVSQRLHNSIKTHRKNLQAPMTRAIFLMMIILH